MAPRGMLSLLAHLWRIRTGQTARLSFPQRGKVSSAVSRKADDR